MPSIFFKNLDPDSAQRGTGFCLLVQVSPGGEAPSVTLTSENGGTTELAVTPLDGARGLWSAYLDDGIDFGRGVLKAVSGTCTVEGAAPERDA